MIDRGWLIRWLAVMLGYCAGGLAVWLGEPDGFQWYAVLAGALPLTVALVLVRAA